MKLIWKGKYINEQQLPVGNLPDDAVIFKEPKTPAMINLAASVFIIPVIIFAGIAVFVKTVFDSNVNFPDVFSIWGVFLAFVMIIPHEFLHALAFPKNAEVQFWYSSENLMAFVYSTCPVSKLKFIYLALLPNIIFGFFPLIGWIFIPSEFSEISKIVFSFATFSLFIGVGDFLNVFHAIIQMPKNSITQLSGFHSYWYLPKVQ